MKNFIRNASLTMLLASSLTTANADQLWDNGDTDGASTLGWGQYSSTLDDFYVPGAGWWIEGAETIGIFIDPATVTSVDVAIWGHDPDNNEPNGSDAEIMTGVEFNASFTGRTFFNREEIKIDISFDKHYLEGQEYYWIELTVGNQWGIENFRYMARQNISHEPSWTHFGMGSIASSQNVYGNDRDLSFALYGQPVRSVVQGSPDKFAAEENDKYKKVYSSILTQPSSTGGLAIKCPRGSSLQPYEMPIYDDRGLFVIGHKTVWFCIPDDATPAG